MSLINKEVADFSNCPEYTYEQKESEEYIQKLIDSLSPDYRMVVVLREIMGFSYEEIARELDITLWTVKSRLNRARKYLKDRIIADREQAAQAARLTAERGKA